jgi:hypothetical protein
MGTKLYKYMIELRQLERSRYAQESCVLVQINLKQEMAKRVNQSLNRENDLGVGEDLSLLTETYLARNT